MTIRELRVRYELPTASGSTVVNAIVCPFSVLGELVRDIRDVGYKIVGVDERFRDEKKMIPIDEGWTEIQPERR